MTSKRTLANSLDLVCLRIRDLNLELLYRIVKSGSRYELHKDLPLLQP